MRRGRIIRVVFAALRRVIRAFRGGRVGLRRRRCRASGKVKFARERVADACVQASRQRWERGRERRPPLQRSYRCEFCGWWHVTSQPRRSA
jgi:hypothetical protein